MESFEDLEILPREFVDQVPESKSASAPGRRRAKTSLRLRYEAEVDVVRKKIGDLETIRGLLGLSQRKICQLLLVDPSAWTRWTRSGGEVPPHIYRMLTWYLALNEKYPALDTGFWLHAVAKTEDPARLFERDQKLESLVRANEELGRELRAMRSELEQFRDRKSELQRLKAKLLWLASLFAAALVIGLTWLIANRGV